MLLEAEIDAEKAKVNRYDSWCRWRQEKAQKHRNELIENKTSQRRDSFFFYSFFSSAPSYLMGNTLLAQMLGIDFS